MATASPPAQSADFRAILRAWPNVLDVAADLGLNPHTVAGWRQRRFIPEKYWSALEEAAARRGYTDVTYQRCRQAAEVCRRDRQARASAGHDRPRRARSDDDPDRLWFATVIEPNLREGLARAEAMELGPFVQTVKEDTFQCYPSSFSARRHQRILRARRNDTEA
jgi:hypothetical protein